MKTSARCNIKPEYRSNRGLRDLMACIFFGLLAILPSSVLAQGGPPMLTDDTDTPGNKAWEINVFSTMVRGRGVMRFEAPNIDLNYGLGDHLQLKFEMPWLLEKRVGNRARTGLGKPLAGVKWRFLGREGAGFSLSTYPQLEFNNPVGSPKAGLVESGARLFLPVEAVKKVGPVEINGELGYRFVQNGIDEVDYGVVIGRRVTKRFEIMVELHGSGVRTLRANELILNAGSRLAIGKNATLLFSAGRTIQNAGIARAEFIATVGIQFTFAGGPGMH